MPLQNRVTPRSELIAAPGRGLVYGNRGCLHDAHGRVRRHFQVKRWIACRLEFRGWQRGPMMQPGRFTELFFLDEATAFAAGHRPCALCRREDYNRFGRIWAELHPGQAGADAIDAQLHSERIDPPGRRNRTHAAAFAELPDGAFVLVEGDAYLVRAIGAAPVVALRLRRPPAPARRRRRGDHSALACRRAAGRLERCRRPAAPPLG